MEHTRYIHNNCTRVVCSICDLFSCSVCGGFEGSLPTDCPGERMSNGMADDVYAGIIDYREGCGWVAPDGTGRSMGDVAIYTTIAKQINELEYEDGIS